MTGCMAVQLVCPCSVREQGRLVPGLGCLTGPGRSAVFCGTVAGLDDRQAWAVCWGDGSWGTCVLCLCPPRAEEPSEHVCLSPTCVGSPCREPVGAYAELPWRPMPEPGVFPPCVGSRGPGEQWLRAGPGPGLGQQGASGPCPLAVWSPRPILGSPHSTGFEHESTPSLPARGLSLPRDCRCLGCSAALPGLLEALCTRPVAVLRDGPPAPAGQRLG